MSSIDDWLGKVSGMVEADQIKLLLHLYEVAGKVRGQKESLDSFVRWGDMILRDFDEIDKYLVDPIQLFRTLTGQKMIDMQFPSVDQDQIEQLQKFWNSFHPSPTSYQAMWLKLWESLSEIFAVYQSRLLAEGIASGGMIYRRAVDLIKEDAEKVLPGNNYAFVAQSVVAGGLSRW